ncbi:MAG: DUF4395 domain-containing protein [Chloroflexi bacterium]|nr:MAG: DUF4395 domain-containing protein [Chloroflexota bacterium]
MATFVDHSALRVNQAGIIATVLLAFLGSFVSVWFELLIPALAVVLLLGTWKPELALFKQLYFKVLKPRGIVKPRVIEDSPVPHNFAQGLGGVFVVVASVLLPILAPAGLALALLVGVLAFINLAFGYCVGCQVYFLLGRTGVLKQA